MMMANVFEIKLNERDALKLQRNRKLCVRVVCVMCVSVCSALDYTLQLWKCEPFWKNFTTYQQLCIRRRQRQRDIFSDFTNEENNVIFRILFDFSIFEIGLQAVVGFLVFSLLNLISAPLARSWQRWKKSICQPFSLNSPLFWIWLND